MVSHNNQSKILIGISSCLLGHKVRFDGNHKHQKLITGELADRFQYVPICPETAIGLGVPRTPIHLVGDVNQQHAVDVKNASVDVTQQLVEFGRQQARQLQHISGYIFKKGSPSCGLFNVKIYKSPTQVLNNGIGLYAREIISAHPLLPVEEEGRLKDVTLRANFLQRVEVYHRWRQLREEGLSRHALVQFHTRHKFIVQAHCEATYRKLGRLVALIGGQPLQSTAEEYISLLMTGLNKPASHGRHTNVLEHMLGFFKRHLDAHDKREMQKIIADYRQGKVPRVVPVTLLKHYLRKYPTVYLANQYYLQSSYADV
jgi:uncharacterized protein YbgA (DUF1722 family)/uncharacterized protein YbbK (DUF523 family)